MPQRLSASDFTGPAVRLWESVDYDMDGDFRQQFESAPHDNPAFDARRITGRRR
jgi:hypothetical protein